MFICLPLLPSLARWHAANKLKFINKERSFLTALAFEELITVTGGLPFCYLLALNTSNDDIRPTWRARNLGVELGLDIGGLQCKLVERRTLYARKEGLIPRGDGNMIRVSRGL